MIPLRVLFAIPELDRGGPDRVLFELLTRLDRNRFAPRLLVSKAEGHYLSRLPADVPVTILGDARARDRYPILRALAKVRRDAPDLVFATLRMNITMGIVARAFPARTRLILRQANDVSADFAMLVKQSPVKHRLTQRVLISAFRRANAIVCQSEAMRRDVGSLMGDFGSLHVIANPIDVDRIATLAAVRSVTLRGRPALVSVGRLMHQKGHDLLLRALTEVRTSHPEVHLTVLGDGPDLGTLRSLARELGIEDIVTFAGFSAEPLPFVRAADLFVLGSRYEGLPNAALEALACGTPIVLTDCPGANSTVVTAVNGRLAATDPAGIARAIEAAIRDLPVFERHRIVADCAARYSCERIVAAYEHLFEAVTAQT